MIQTSYHSLFLKNSFFLDNHVTEHDSILEEKNANGDEGQDDRLEEEDPFAPGADRIKSADSIGNGVEVGN